MAARKVYVVGNGMTKFEKPGRNADLDYPVMAREAVTKALLDSGVNYKQVQQVYAGYCFGDSTCGQRAVYPLGMTSVPIINVNNNCSTGSTALYLARQAVSGGTAECVLALGFEKMAPGSLSAVFNDRTNPLDTHLGVMSESRGLSSGPMAAQFFGNAGIQHMEQYGTKDEHFAKIGEKNHRHSALNPYSQFRDIYTLEQVSKSRKIHGPLTMLQCCPTSDGAAAAILVSEAFVLKHGLQSQAIEIAGQAMATDGPEAFSGDALHLAGYGMSETAAKEACSLARISPDQVGVVELHDCFSANELITYEALGLCPKGKAGEYIDRNAFTYGGKVVVNPSGGLISKGHPLGATGLAQCAELCWQLRGSCGNRQVQPVPKYAMQHNIGLGGAAVVTVYTRGFPSVPVPDPSKSRLGYNQAVEARGITDEDVSKVAPQPVAKL